MTRPIPDAIAKGGWNYSEKCRCGGILKYKFTHPSRMGYKVEWYVLYDQFAIKHNGKKIIAATSLSKFEETIKGL